LSVLIPNFNHGHYLEGCLGSIFSQSVLPDEVLVCDDASTDNSLEILQNLCQRYPRLRLVRHQHNQGVRQAMTTLIHESQGRYCYFLGADDEVAQGLFQAVAPVLSVESEPALIFFDLAAEVTVHGQRKIVERVFGGPAGPRSSRQIQQRIRSLPPYLLAGPACIWHRQRFLEFWSVAGPMGPLLDVFAATAVAFRYGGYYVPGSFNVFRILPGSYGSMLQDRSRARPMYRILLDALRQPELRDVADGFRNSAMLAHYGFSSLLEILRLPANWYLLTPAFGWRFLVLQLGARLRGKSAGWYARLKSWLYSFEGAGPHSGKARS